MRYGFSEIQAGFLFPLPYVVAAISSPIIGLLIEKFGHRNRWSVVGSLLMILAHFMQLFIPDCQECVISIFPLVFLGISYGTYAVAQWGALPYIVEHRTLGTAFGIVNVFENLGTVFAPPILGWIETNTKE